jgi:hypothetical protein
LGYDALLDPDQGVSIVEYLVNNPGLAVKNEIILSKLIISIGELADNHYRSFMSDLSVDKIKALPKSVTDAMGAMTKIAYVKYDELDLFCVYEMKMVKAGLTPETQADKVFAILDKGMASTDINNRSLFVWVIESLVNKKLIKPDRVDQILQLVEKGIASSTVGLQDNSMSAIRALVINGFVKPDHVNQIMSWVEKGMASSNGLLQYNSMFVIRELILNELVIPDHVDQILQFIKEGMASPDTNVHNGSMYAIRELVDKELVKPDRVDQILNWIDKGMQSFEQDVQRNSMYAIRALVDKELVKPDKVEQILNWIDKGMRSWHPNDQLNSMRAIQSLVDKGLVNSHNVGPVLSILDKAKQSNEVDVKSLSEQLSEKLLPLAAKIEQPAGQSMLDFASHGSRAVSGGMLRATPPALMSHKPGAAFAEQAKKIKMNNDQSAEMMQEQLQQAQNKDAQNIAAQQRAQFDRSSLEQRQIPIEYHEPAKIDVGHFGYNQAKKTPYYQGMNHAKLTRQSIKRDLPRVLNKGFRAIAK